MSLSNVQVGVDQRVRADIKLEVGAMTESVEIVAQTPLVQTSSSDLSTTVTEEQIKQLPLNGRNFVSLTRTIPGVLRGIPGSNIDGAGSLAWRASAAFSANGQRPRDNNYMLDGVDNNETWLQTVVVFPSVDALDEFKLQTSTYSAEFGRSLGGVVNIQIKSGSNAFHGSAFEFNRNDAFDANNFFNNRAGRAKPDFKQNQFGGTLGGPICKDKTFFFGDYQGLRINAGQTYLSTVPTLKMRNGDFSEINRVIYDPQTGQPFPGNVIPQQPLRSGLARTSSPSSIPSRTPPERIAANGQNINNYLINPTLTRNDDQGDFKVDHVLTNSNRFFFRYSYQKTQRDLPATLPHGDAGATFGAGNGNIKAQSLAFNDTHTFGANWLNEFRFGWTSIKFFMTPIDYGTNPAAAVGIPGINLNDATSAMTQLRFQNIRNLGANSNQPLITNQNDFQFFDNVTWLKGKHTLKAGGSLTLRSREILNADTIVGNFGFNNNQTSNCAGLPAGCTINSATGFDVASFLLGYAVVEDAQPVRRRRPTPRSGPSIALYVQDDFRLASKLTVNLGLRWDVYRALDRGGQPPVELRRDRPASSSSRRRRGRSTASKVGRYLQTYSKADFGPRLGVAYDVRGDGRTHHPRRLRRVLELHARRHVVVEGAEPAVPAVDGADDRRRAARHQPARCRTACRRRRASIRTVRRPAPRGRSSTSTSATPTRDNWNINMQRGFGTNYMVEIAYVGSQGRQMMLKGDSNQAPPVVGVTDANINRPFMRRWRRRCGASARRRAPARSTTTRLLMKFQRRFANNFSILNAYTYGKSIDLNSDNDGTVTLTNVYDPQYNRGPSDYDVKHTLSTSWVYELPWAQDKLVWRLADQRHPLPPRGPAADHHADAGRAVDGHGQPAEPRSATASRRTRPSTSGSTRRRSCRRPTSQVPTVIPAAASCADPGQFNIDFSLIKGTKIGKIDTEFRVEAFNVLNHPQFGKPNTTFGNAGVRPDHDDARRTRRAPSAARRSGTSRSRSR